MVRRTLHDRAVEDVVQQADRLWMRGGVPTRQRRRMVAELRDHLYETVATGGRVTDVVGDDPARFAAQWQRSARPTTWPALLIDVILPALALTGALSLIGPLTGRSDAGLTATSIGIVAVAAIAAPAREALVSLRQHAPSWGTAAVVAVGVAAVFVVSTQLVGSDPGELLVPVPPPVAITLTAAGVAGYVLRWRAAR